VEVDVEEPMENFALGQPNRKRPSFPTGHSPIVTPAAFLPRELPKEKPPSPTPPRCYESESGMAIESSS